jgi:uracil-DNA glycosylase
MGSAKEQGEDVKIESSWKKALQDEFGKDYFKKLREFVKGEYSHAIVYPAPKNIFRAFELCPFDKVEVVILGQDPYHGLGQANGLCFAVSDGVALPPSLQNIFKELSADCSLPHEALAKKGSLEDWSKQGILLLNATLTVAARSAGSHQGKGWEEFTDAVIRKLSDERKNLVFILWGNYARVKGAHIDRTEHLVIESAHPSPFSASNGFFGSKPFSKTNEYLAAHGKEPIDWL